ncbi:hypothetical protein ACLB1Q_34975 [Escherichia coli]
MLPGWSDESSAVSSTCRRPSDSPHGIAESDAAIFLKRAIVARMLQKIKYQDSEVLKDCLGDFFIYEQREKLRRLGVITNWGINKTADGKNNKL